MAMGSAEGRYPETRAGEWALAGGGAVPMRYHEARSLRERFLGLMGVGAVETGFCLWFPRDTSMHMFFMRAPIDLVWLASARPDGSRPIVRVDRSLPPWRVRLAPKGAVGFLEAAAGSVPATAEAAILPWRG